MVNFSLEGKVALVTGASYGIGLLLLQLLLKRVQLSCLTTLNRNWLTKVWLHTKKKVSMHTVMYAT